jgi:hypothetical protein
MEIIRGLGLVSSWNDGLRLVDPTARREYWVFKGYNRFNN